MERIWFYYYSFLFMLLVIAFGYYYVQGTIPKAPSQEHFIGVNLTKDNGTCKLIWLGGWDFDAFYTNVTVNGVNVGHPFPMATIYNDTCKDIEVRMHDRAVHTDMLLYRYNHTEGH